MQWDLISLFFTVAVMQLLALMLPGPDMILTIQNTLRYQRRIGLWTALGLAVGMTSTAVISAFFLPLLIQQQTVIVWLIRYAGALYLSYLGWRVLRSPLLVLRQAIGETSSIAVNASAHKIFIDAVMCNLLNPKSLLFYISLFSMLLTANVSVIFRVSCVVEMFFAGLLWFSLIAVLLSGQRLQARIQQIEHAQQYLNYCCAGFFWFFALLLALMP